MSQPTNPRTPTSTDEQSQAEQLDEDVLGADAIGQVGDDALAVGFPPERPQGVGERGVTPAGSQVRESVEERARREQPEVPPPPVDADVGQPLDPASDPDVAGDQAAASEGAQTDRPSAEEAALHLTGPPPIRPEDDARRRR